jgi:glycosyltransferase involved in cell wall biosynthesis
LCLFLPSFHAGGAERVALSLIEWFLDRGYEVDLVLASAEGELLRLLPEKVRLFDLEASRLRQAIFPFVRYLRERKPAAVQAFMWPLTCVAVIAHRLSGGNARLVLSDHTTLSHGHSHFGILGKLFLRHSIRWLYPAADARIIVSADAADDLARVSAMDRESFEIVYNPVALPSEPACAADDLWRPGAARIISVGKLKLAKNHALLLEAFARVAARRNAQLMIVGEGPLEAEILQKATRLGIADQLIMAGLKLNPWPYYASADLFVLSSNHEGYPLVLVEALWSGLKVVSTDCPSGPREILDRGRFGRLVPVGDAAALFCAIEQALDDNASPEMLRLRAEELSAGACEAHERLMLGFPAVSATHSSGDREATGDWVQYEPKRAVHP